MHGAYWFLAGLLCVFYLYAGGKKVTQGREQLRPMMAWVDSTPLPAVRTIGVLEVLGAVGLIVPALTGIAPALSLAASVGFVLLQVGATALHLRRGERSAIGLNLALVVAAAITAWLATTWL